ncbi:tetratricopeptide repeat protein [Salinispira pacifica]
MTTISLPLPAKQKLAGQYAERVDVYEKVLYEFQRRLKQSLHRIPVPATVKYRVKGFESLYEKLLRKLKSTGQHEGVVQVTDLLGIRVVCAFIEDLNKAEEQIRQSLDVIEVERKGSNFTVKEFGYESTHYLVRVPDDIVDSFHVDADVVCEIQLRTILQDAWAEVEHELVYKAEFTPFDEPLRRKLAALNANLSLSDIIFQEIRDYQRQLHLELRKRRDLFWRKLAEVTGDTGPAVRSAGEDGAEPPDQALAEHAPADQRPSGSDAEGAGPSPDGAAAGGERGGGSDRGNGAAGSGAVSADSARTGAPRTSDPASAEQSADRDGSHQAAYASMDVEGSEIDDEEEGGNFVRSLMMGSETIDNMLLRALAAHNQNRLELAIRIYSEILAYSPKEYIQAIIHVHRGMAYFTRSEYLMAIDDFSRAIELDARNPKAYYYRGVVHRVLSHYSQALEDLNACLELDPYQFDPLYTRGQVYFQLGDYGGSLQDIDRALSIQPEAAQCRRFRAMITQKIDNK